MKINKIYTSNQIISGFLRYPDGTSQAGSCNIYCGKLIRILSFTVLIKDIHNSVELQITKREFELYFTEIHQIKI